MGSGVPRRQVASTDLGYRRDGPPLEGSGPEGPETVKSLGEGGWRFEEYGGWWEWASGTKGCGPYLWVINSTSS